VGEIILLKSEGFHDSSPGFWTIIANIPANITQVDNTASIKDPEVILKYQNAQYYPIQSVLGKFLCSKDVLLLIGEDGAARVFYINEMFGSGIAAKTKILKAKVSQKGIHSFQQRKQSQNNNNNNKSNNEVDEGLVDYYEYYLPAEEKKQSQTAASEETTRNLIASGSFRLTKKSEASMKHREEKSAKLQSQKTHRERSQEKYEQILSHSEQERKRKNNNNISSRRKSSSSGGSSSPLKGMTRSNPVLASPTKFFSKMKKVDKSNNDQQTSNQVVGSPVHSFVTGNNPANKNKDSKKKSSSLTISTLEAASESNALPLFELATLTPKEKRVNFLKLQAFLTKNGKNGQPLGFVF
jgi:hypothetical protein